MHPWDYRQSVMRPSRRSAQIEGRRERLHIRADSRQKLRSDRHPIVSSAWAERAEWTRGGEKLCRLCLEHEEAPLEPRGCSRRRLNPIAHLGSARAHSAMCTAEDAAVLLHAMPDHPASAMRTSRSERLYCAFEAVEDVGRVLHDDLKGLVVRVATNLALCGRHADDSSLARLARPSNGRPIVGASADGRGPTAPLTRSIENGRRHSRPFSSMIPMTYWISRRSLA